MAFEQSSFTARDGSDPVDWIDPSVSFAHDMMYPEGLQHSYPVNLALGVTVTSLGIAPNSTPQPDEPICNSPFYSQQNCTLPYTYESMQTIGVDLNVSSEQTLGHSGVTHISPYNYQPGDLTHVDHPATIAGIAPVPAGPELRSYPQSSPVPKRESQTREQEIRQAVRHNVLGQSNYPRTTVKKDNTGHIQGTLQIFGTDVRIRSRMNSGDREASRRTRNGGGQCNKCKYSKKRCNRPEDKYSPCPSCKRIAKTFDFRKATYTDKIRGIVRYPCAKIDIQSLFLNRRGPTRTNQLNEWLSRKSRLLNSSDGNTLDATGYHRQVNLTQDIPGLDLVLPVTITRFHPNSNDTTAYHWPDAEGKDRTMEMLPYCVFKPEDAAEKLVEYYQRSWYIYAKSLMEENPIIQYTFNAAFQKSSKSRLLLYALQLWTATRLTEKTWYIRGGERHGFTVPMEEGNPWHGKVPVTPIMDTQLDEITIRYLLLPMADRLLRELDSKMKSDDRKDWFEVYLALFIILNNFELIFRDVREYASRHGMTKSASLQGSSESLSQHYVHACRSLLSRFHFAFPGSFPLRMIRKESFEGSEVITPEQAEYLRALQKEVARQDSTLSGWRDNSMYQMPLYWTNQLWVDDWAGDIAHIEPIDNFTEDDFITSKH